MTNPNASLSAGDYAMSVAINATETAYQSLTKIGQNVDLAVGALQGGWSGDAATAYQNGLSVWREDYQAILSQVSGLHDNLVTTKSTWDNIEDTNTQIA